MAKNLQLQRPSPLLQRDITVSAKDLMKALASGTAHLVTGAYTELVVDAADAAAALGLKENPSETAWLLVERSLSRATLQLLSELRSLISLRSPDNEVPALQLILKGSLPDTCIDHRFFENPRAWSALPEIGTRLESWLLHEGVESYVAKAVAARLPSYFALALHEEWTDSPARWAIIQQHVDSPFTRSSDSARAWARYEAWLWRQLDEPLFGDSISLRQLYIPLRGYRRETSTVAMTGSLDPTATDQVDAPEGTAFDLATELDRWLATPAPDDYLRVISGGPGSGKSSFVRTYATKTLSSGQWYVLYIPLHIFDPKGDLRSAIAAYVRTGGLLPSSPLEELGNTDRRILLVFDGLDELAMQGRSAETVASNFVREVERSLTLMNMMEPRVVALLAGRELVIQASASDLRRPGQILHVLPYHVANTSGLSEPDVAQRDQRDDWWAKYTHAKRTSGQPTESMPALLKQGELGALTSQPLLNYLVTLSYERGKIHAGSNLNGVYSDLVDAVYERAYEGRRHQHLQQVNRNDFRRVLQEIAVSAWQGNGRTTTVSSIRRHFERARMGKVLSAFQDGAEAGVTSLLAAFYFRQHGTASDGDRTFEFTHKSFGEYLAAVKLCRSLETTCVSRRERDADPDRGWSANDALSKWLELTGPTGVDSYLARFVVREIANHPRDMVLDMQTRVAEMLSLALAAGMPFTRIDPRPGFLEECRMANNAEEALAICANACAQASQERTSVEWPHRSSAGAWIKRLQGQRIGPGNRIILDCLGGLDFRDSCFDLLDLFGANLSNCGFAGGALNYTSLGMANLSGASFEGATLAGIWIDCPTIDRASFKGARISDLSLRRVRFVNCSFRNATFMRSRHDSRFPRLSVMQVESSLAPSRVGPPNQRTYPRPDFVDCDFTGSFFDSVDFRGAVFSACDFDGAQELALKDPDASPRTAR